MSGEDQAELEMLAAEHVLGLLGGEQRARLDRRQQGDPQLQRLIAAWERRLAPLAEGVAPVPPPAGLWPRLERSVAGTVTMRRAVTAAPRPGLWRRLGFWRFWAALATLAAAALAGLLLVRPPLPAEIRLVAVLDDGEQRPAFVLSAMAGLAEIAVRPLGPAPAAAQVPELWLLPGEDRPPISLGVLATDATWRRPVRADLVPLLTAGRPLAVSLEPAGGSATTGPSGPIVYRGRLVELPAP